MSDEIVNTGGNIRFVYPKGYNPKLDSKTSRKIDEAYERYYKRKGRKNHNHIEINKPKIELKEEYKEPIIKKESYTPKATKKFPIKLTIFFFVLLVLLIIIWKTGIFGLIEYQKTLAESKNLSDYGFSQVNTFKDAKKLPELIKSDSAYELALFLAKEKLNGKVYETESEKQKVISDFGLSSETGVFQGILKENGIKGVDSVVLRWVYLQEEKLLDRNYTSGAVGCWKTVCFFVLDKQKVEEVKNTISVTQEIINKPNNPVQVATDNSSWYDQIITIIEGPKIDDTWVHNFMNIINSDRAAKGLSAMQESSQLNTLATARFNKMMEQPYITHYGAAGQLPGGSGEVVFYPAGSNEQDYANNIQQTAILHWNLLMDPMFSHYGYHIEDGPNLVIVGSCPTTELPGPNIDVKQFFEQQGCSTEAQNSIWLVIDMA